MDIYPQIWVMCIGEKRKRSSDNQPCNVDLCFLASPQVKDEVVKTTSHEHVVKCW